MRSMPRWQRLPPSPGAPHAPPQRLRLQRVVDDLRLHAVGSVPELLRAEVAGLLHERGAMFGIISSEYLAQRLTLRPRIVHHAQTLGTRCHRHLAGLVERREGLLDRLALAHAGLGRP